MVDIFMELAIWLQSRNLFARTTYNESHGVSTFEGYNNSF